MEFRIADSFQKSLEKLTNRDQKIVKTKAFDIQLNISGNSIQFHRLDRAKDSNFWSVRVNSDIRIIVHKAGHSVMLTYVNHHDEAYRWASNKVIRKHPVTKAAQIIELEEVENTSDLIPQNEVKNDKGISIFSNIDPELLHSAGVPNEFVKRVLECDENTFYDLIEYLPAEAAETLIDYLDSNRAPERLVTLGISSSQENDEALDEFGLNHPDAKRRFALITDEAELRAALDFPWHRWTVFLHPDQQKYTQLTYIGAARVSGSAGTGKTIVALHRAVHLHKLNPSNKILLSTFTKTLAAALKQKLEVLVSGDALALEQIKVTHLEGVAFETLKRRGNTPNIVSKTQLTNFLRRASQRDTLCDYKIGFLISEWENVIDAWGVETLDEYLNISRTGRKSKLGVKQRSDLWSIFEETRKLIDGRKLTTWSSIFRDLKIESDPFLKYDHVIIDEAQDISVAELSFLAKNFSKNINSLFFAGDVGQRIFRAPFSWSSLGIDVRGKSNILRVNYRTSQEIRKQADQLLPTILKDQDLNDENRTRTISVFSGQEPKVALVDTDDDEAHTVSEWIRKQISDGVMPREIGVFVRNEHQYKRASRAIKQSGNTGVVLNYKLDGDDSSINYGTMHLAKGLEFRSVAIMACDRSIIPCQERLALFTEKADLEYAELGERQLLYVACTRARESLLVTGVGTGSKYLYELV